MGLGIEEDSGSFIRDPFMSLKTNIHGTVINVLVIALNIDAE